MKRHIAILALFGALLYGAASYTQSDSALYDVIHNTIDPAAARAVQTVQQLPFVRLLNWENEYHPRPTTRPLQVVPATETPYSPEEIAEIYPSM